MCNTVLTQDYVCTFCKSEFTRKWTLKRHQETNYSCLKIQNRDEKYLCSCGKKANTKSVLKLHEKKCQAKKIIDKCVLSKKILREKNKKLTKSNETLRVKVKSQKDDIVGLKEEITLLKGTIEGIQTAPDKRTIYNTAYVHPKLVNLPISNIPALTDEYVMERVNDGILTYEKASKGYSGMLDIICDLITHENDEGIIERNYVCTDVSRNSFHRLLESKKWKSDKGGRYLNNMIDTFRDAIEEHKDKVYQKYKDTPHDSIEWENVEWERKKISQLYSGIVCREGTGDREELVNILRKEISKRASV